MKCERKVQRPLLILAPLFFIINSPVIGVVITQVSMTSDVYSYDHFPAQTLLF